MNDDRNWMSSFGATGGARPAAPDRPVTAGTQNAKIREIQNELKSERRDKQKLID
jgi:hypothetical protein